MASKPIQLDRVKVRAEVRKLGNEYVADEGCSWQVGVGWARVLPVWFELLSATAAPKDYAERITALLSRHYSYRQAEMLTIARRIATEDQRKALVDSNGG